MSYLFASAAPTVANDNRARTAAGCSYYPEMGERPPVEALIEAQLSHYGRHYYLKFSEANRAPVMAAIAAAKVRFNGEETFASCITGEQKTTICMTTKAYDKLRKLAPTICTSAILLD